jgi:hypothetical protein
VYRFARTRESTKPAAPHTIAETSSSQNLRRKIASQSSTLNSRLAIARSVRFERVIGTLSHHYF